MFPWFGTRSFRTLKRILSLVATEFAISAIESGGSYFITFRMERGNAEMLEDRLVSVARSLASTDILVSQKELPVFEKYDEYVPAELLRSAFARDRLDLAEIRDREDRKNS
jgi:ATP-dependent Lhr-like helicase